jgi:hypothetical protein
MTVKWWALGCVFLGVSSCHRESPNEGQRPQALTDVIFAVISANRDTYARHVVNRLQYEQRILVATEHFREEKALPLPAQMLRMSADEVARTTNGQFGYSLLSLWPVNKQNGPRTESEKLGLRTVAETGKNHYTEEILGGEKYFVAYYPDKGVVDACVKCHNDHKDSPRRDFRIGDVMGGIVIRVKVAK